MTSSPSVDPVRERIAEMQSLADAATAGPWSFHEGDLWAGATAEQLGAYNADPESDGESNWPPEWRTVFDGDPVRPEDAAFIAAARSDVPALAAVLVAVLDLHQPYVSRMFAGEVTCTECGDQEWPCATFRALAAAGLGGVTP